MALAQFHLKAKGLESIRAAVAEVALSSSSPLQFRANLSPSGRNNAKEGSDIHTGKNKMKRMTGSGTPPSAPSLDQQHHLAACRLPLAERAAPGLRDHSDPTIMTLQVFCR